MLVQKGHMSAVPGISEPKRQRTGETLNRSDSEQVVQEQEQEQEVFSGRMLQNGKWTNANITALKTWKTDDYMRSKLKTPGLTNIKKDLVFWNKFSEEIGIASSVTPQQVYHKWLRLTKDQVVYKAGEKRYNDLNNGWISYTALALKEASWKEKGNPVPETMEWHVANVENKMQEQAGSLLNGTVRLHCHPYASSLDD